MDRVLFVALTPIPFNSIWLIPCSGVMLLVDAASGRVQCADTRTLRRAAHFRTLQSHGGAE